METRSSTARKSYHDELHVAEQVAGKRRLVVGEDTGQELQIVNVVVLQVHHSSIRVVNSELVEGS
jgi:hypothetical protein